MFVLWFIFSFFLFCTDKCTVASYSSKVSCKRSSLSEP